MSGHLPGADEEVRKHLWRGLDRLGPAKRVAFLKHLCKLVNFHTHEVRVTSSTGTTSETFADVMMLAFQHGLSLQRAATELEHVLRRL